MFKLNLNKSLNNFLEFIFIISSIDYPILLFIMSEIVATANTDYNSKQELIEWINDLLKVNLIAWNFKDKQ